MGKSDLTSSESCKYLCVACEARHETFGLFCADCKSTDTITESEDEEELEILASNNWRSRQRAKRALRIDTTEPVFVSTGRPAWDATLGGGFVQPSAVLVPGCTGVGKSTSLLRIADHIGTTQRRPVLYGSAEMPAKNIKHLCERLHLSMEFLWINDSGSFESMHEDILELRPAVIVWDSLQRFHVDDQLGIVETRQVLLGAMGAGKRSNAITIFTSHVTKDEDFSGENGIAHDVDAVIWIRKVGPNLISIECPLKNRNAPTPMRSTEALYESHGR